MTKENIKNPVYEIGNSEYSYNFEILEELDA